MHEQAIESHATSDLRARKIFLLGRDFLSSRCTGAEGAQWISLSFEVEEWASRMACFYVEKVSLAAILESREDAKGYCDREESHILRTHHLWQAVKNGIRGWVRTDDWRDKHEMRGNYKEGNLPHSGIYPKSKPFSSSTRPQMPPFNFKSLKLQSHVLGEDKASFFECLWKVR